MQQRFRPGKLSGDPIVVMTAAKQRGPGRTTLLAYALVLGTCATTAFALMWVAVNAMILPGEVRMCLGLLAMATVGSLCYLHGGVTEERACREVHGAPGHE